MTEQIKQILEQYEQNKVVYVDREGKHAISFDELLSSTSDDVLRKTNRTAEVLLRLAEKNPESLKWVNDYAMAKIVERLFEMNNENNSQIIFKNTEIEKLQLEIERMKQSTVSVELSDELVTNNTKLKNEYDNLLKKFDELKQTYDATLTEYDGLLQEKDEIISKINKQLEDKIEELKTVNNECNVYAAELDKMSGKHHHISFKFDELTKKFDTLQKHADEEKNMLNEQLNKTNNELDDSISRYNILQDEFKKLSGDFDELKTDNTNINKQLEDLKNAEERLVIERDAALENESIAIKQHDDIKREYKMLTERIEKLTFENNNLNKQLEQQNKNNEAIKKIREILNIETHISTNNTNTNTRIGSNQVSDFNIL